MDYAQYAAVANQSFGTERDGVIIGRKLLAQSSPGASNGSAAVRPTMLVERAGAGVRVSWNSVQGQTYFVDAATDLATPDWQQATQLTGTGGSLSYTDSLPQNNQHRYFRIRTN